MDRPPEGFEMIARMPEQAARLEEGPYRSGTATRRLPWVTLRWRARSEDGAMAHVLIGVFLAVVASCIALVTPVGGALLCCAAGALIAAPKNARAPMRLTVTDRFISGGRGGLLASGIRLPLRRLRDVLLFAPGAIIGEQRVSGTWWLALRDRDGTCHLLTTIDDEPAARWLLRGVRALIAERTT